MPGEYTADDIKVLEGLEGVRRRPAMYIGDTSSGGMHHLLFEVVDNSVDEVMAGYCSEILVRINEDGSATVVDNGRGIPVGKHKETGLSALEVVMTRLHAGGKFEQKAYRVSGGLHGVGVSVVNALSQWLEVEVADGKYLWHQRYERGRTATPLSKRGKTDRRGTKVVFKPDPEIFSEAEFSFETVARRMREVAFLNPRVTITVEEEGKEKKESFHYEKGLRDFVEYLNSAKNVLHKDVIVVSGDHGNVHVEAALQYHDGYTESIASFVNTINTVEGGTHVSGFRSGLTRTLNRYLKKEGVLKGQKSLSGEDFREGLTAVIALRMPEPQFESQTKIKLGNREVQGLVESVLSEGLSEYLEEHPKTARAIGQKAVTAARAREAARKAKELVHRKDPLSSGSLPGKLADCSSRDRETTELFLVEGDSAGGTAKTGRDRRFQAILPLRGKILNVEKARIEKVLGHEEIRAIVQALGVGIGDEDMDLERLRYNKVIIMTDADVDGSHIRTLLLTFFYRHMNPLVRENHIYVAQPPLYRIKRGKKEFYLHSDVELKKWLVELGMEAVKVRRVGGGQAIRSDVLRRVLRTLADLERLDRAFRHVRMTLSSYLALWDAKKGHFPLYWLRTRDGEIHYLYSEDEFEKMQRRLEKEKSGELEIASFEDVSGEADVDVLFHEFRERSEVEQRVTTLMAAGFSVEDLFGDRERTNRFAVEHDGGERKAASLAEVSELVKRTGTRGADIQRYKGLGEMNADQLWRTTMDPERRTLMRVAVDDAAEADRLFTILMGSQVEPRREFIEKYALDVRRLDV